MNPHMCSEASVKTKEQPNCSFWFELRYARTTASKIYNAAHCKKSDGTLVDQILGVSKFKGTEAMKRGKNLEKYVIKSLEKTLRINISHTGLLLNPKHPIFGASPDETLGGVINIQPLEARKC
ncbi:hypothetical protein NQ318_023586 [Aromia moschata]|uniref:YqaJ viral recombinase domain-containing protein n=1 Tax=Aromia moschata TaxID=1265417 RepID=A0AAV8YS26_9CUCU|nr:hypothetical protein NQ318_023586 [Aromia moschata]